MPTERSLLPDQDYRADIDGLRAVAITLVVAYHLQDSLIPAGFVGVDVFFVISGFLITRMIVDGLERESFSLTSFYARRIRRIFPALIVVLAATWLIGWQRLLPEDFDELGRQILAGAAFSSNLLNYSEAGYFDAPAATKPLLHLWSLGVEEQFYLAMPLLLIVAVRRGVSLAWGLGLTAALSFAGSIVLVGYSQPAAFYLPFTRFWELLIGGGLAYATTHWSWHIRLWQTKSLQREPLSLIGIALIIAAACLSRAAEFPGWWAVLPVLGSALVIAAGPATLINRALSTRPAVALGLISYPLYLWHWPLLVLLHNPDSRGHWIILLSVFLAAGTYLLVERPARWLRLPRVAVTSLIGMAVIVLFAGAATQTDGMPGRFKPPIPEVFLPVPRPVFYPPDDDARNVAGPKVLLWGDSHAAHLNPGFIAIRAAQPIRLFHEAFTEDCNPLQSRPETQRCMDALASSKRHVAALQPDIIVVSALWSLYSPLNLDGLADVLAFARQAGKHLFVIGPDPRWPQPLRSEVAKAYLKDPQSGVPQRLNTFLRFGPELEQSVSVAAKRHAAAYIPVMDKLCNSDGCLVRVGDKPGDIIQFDDNHFSKAGSEYFVKLIIGQILNNDVAAR